MIIHYAYGFQFHHAYSVLMFFIAYCIGNLIFQLPFYNCKHKYKLYIHCLSATGKAMET